MYKNAKKSVFCENVGLILVVGGFYLKITAKREWLAPSKLGLFHLSTSLDEEADDKTWSIPILPSCDFCIDFQNLVGLKIGGVDFLLSLTMVTK